MSIERWKCRVCGKIGLGRIPKGGDGTDILPYRHKHQGKPCPGYFESAIPVDEDASEPEATNEEDCVAEWNRRFGWLRSADKKPEPTA